MYDSEVLFGGISFLLVVIFMWKFPFQDLLKLMSMQECGVSLGYNQQCFSLLEVLGFK